MDKPVPHVFSFAGSNGIYERGSCFFIPFLHHWFDNTAEVKEISETKTVFCPIRLLWRGNDRKVSRCRYFGAARLSKGWEEQCPVPVERYRDLRGRDGLQRWFIKYIFFKSWAIFSGAQLSRLQIKLLIILYHMRLWTGPVLYFTLQSTFWVLFKGHPNFSPYHVAQYICSIYMIT